MNKLSREWIIENVLTQFEGKQLPDLKMLEEILYAKDLQDDIKAMLEACQNEDGGFKAWLEPDIQSEKSTMIATSVALKMYAYLGEIDASIALKVSKYLEDKFNIEEQRWNILSSDVSEDPHAFWWNEEMEKTFGYVNPSATIISCVEVLEIPLNENIKRILHKNIESLTVMDNIHNYACLDHYYTLMNFEYPKVVLEGASQLIVTDKKEWNTYVPKPLDVVTSPSHPLYETHKDSVDSHLDYIIEQLKENKVLSPTWKWGQFEEHFDKAAKMWQQRLTYKAINDLFKFGRID